MAMQITIGGMRDHQHLVEGLRLPVFPDLPAVALISDGLARVTKSRRMGVVEGLKASGKTVGLKVALARAAKDEDDAHDLDQDHRKRKVLRVRRLEERHSADVLVALLRRVLGNGFKERGHGGRRDPEALRTQLLKFMGSMNYTVIVVEEAEYISDAALQELRHLVSDAEEESDAHYEPSDDATGGTVGRVGVGVLLVGAPHVRAKAEKSEEARVRLVYAKDIPICEEATVPDIYLRWCPGFEPHVQALGGHDAWKNWIQSTITRNKDLPIGHIANHVEAYWDRLTCHEASVRSLHQMPFIEDLFLSTWAESQLQNSAKA